MLTKGLSSGKIEGDRFQSFFFFFSFLSVDKSAVGHVIAAGCKGGTGDSLDG